MIRCSRAARRSLTGSTLAHLLHGGRNKLAVEGCRSPGLPDCLRIAGLHDHGYLHLDGKPGNVIVQDGIARLIDLSPSHPPGPGEGLRGRGAAHLELCGGDRAGVLLLRPAGERRYEQLTSRAPRVRRLCARPRLAEIHNGLMSYADPETVAR